MLIEPIFFGPGPNPKTPFTTQMDGPALLIVSGSASPAPGGSGAIGVSLYIDGVEAGSAWVYASKGETHKTLVPVVLPIKIKPGDHTLSIVNVAGAVTDNNDLFSVSLLEIGMVQPFLWSFKGPVPQYTTFQSEVQGTAMVFFAGSGYSRQGGQTIGFPLVLDGKNIAATFTYVNEANSHHAVPPGFVPLSLTYGQHKLGLSTINGDFQTDANDYYTVAIVY